MDILPKMEYTPLSCRKSRKTVPTRNKPYHLLSDSQRERVRDNSRRKHLERELRKGRVPKPKKAAPYLEELYLSYGIQPNVDVFIPKMGVPKEIEQRQRRRYKYEKYEKPKGEPPALAAILLRCWNRSLGE